MKKFLRVKNKRELFNSWSLLTQLGVTMITTVGLMFFLGLILDNWLGTTPWMLLVCMLLGVGAAFRNLLHLTADFSRTKPRDKTPVEGGRPPSDD